MSAFSVDDGGRTAPLTFGPRKASQEILNLPLQLGHGQAVALQQR